MAVIITPNFQGCRGQDRRGRGQNPRGRGQDPRGQAEAKQFWPSKVNKFYHFYHYHSAEASNKAVASTGVFHRAISVR